MQLYIEGVVFGVIPVFFIGPVFFTLMQASLREGFGAGAMVAAGITASDVVCVLICALGVASLFETSWGTTALQLGGGLILLAFGLVGLLSKGAAERDVDAVTSEAPRGSSKARHFTSGFLVNFVNPFVLTFWVGAIGAVSVRHGQDLGRIALFFSGTITTIFVTDLLKAWGAGRLRRALRAEAMPWIQRAVGLCLMGFGVYMIGLNFWQG